MKTIKIKMRKLDWKTSKLIKSGEYLLRLCVINILSFQKKMTNSSQNESRLPAVVFPMIVLWGGKNNDSMVISEIENYFFPIFFSCFFFCHLPHPPHPPLCLKWANIKVLSPSGGASFFLWALAVAMMLFLTHIGEEKKNDTSNGLFLYVYG